MTGRLRGTRAALPGLLVLLVVVASALAAGKQGEQTTETTGGTAVTLSRTLSCIPDVRASSVRIGTVPASATGSATTPGKAGRVVFGPGQAADAYGVQWSAAKGWFAARACVAPADDWWFVGAGAGISHRSILTLDNPRSNDANVTIAVYGPMGQVDAPGLSGLLVPAGQSLRIDLESVAPALGDLSVHVSAIRGLVAASMWEQWAQSAVSKPVSSWVPSAPAPAAEVQLIGLPTKATHATLLVTNPSSASALVNLKVANPSATFAPTRHQAITVPPESTSAIGIDDLLRAGVGAVELSSSTPITAGLRAVRGTLESYAAPGLRLGAESALGLPSGIPASLMLAAPTAEQVSLRVVDAHGAVLLERAVDLPAGRIVSIALPKSAAALRLSGDRHSAVAGAVVLDNGHIAVLGLVPTANAARVPAVIARPY